MAPTYRDNGFGASQVPQLGLPRMTKVTRRLLVANALVALPCFLLWLADSELSGGLLHFVGLDPRLWAAWAPFVPVWQLFTYGFLHSFADIWHLLMNLLGLYFFGTMLEERLGGRRFFLTYLAAQVVGGCFYLVPLVLGWMSGPAIGASGAVLGLIAAAATLYPRQRVIFVMFPVQLMWLALIIVGADVYSYLVSLKTGGDSVAHLVHLGGAAYGFAAVKLGFIDKDPLEILERKRAVREVQREADDQVRMDRLLEKIHQEGMGSLSRSEKDFLRRMSSRR